jgi:peroxiredoxin
MQRIKTYGLTVLAAWMLMAMAMPATAADDGMPMKQETGAMGDDHSCCSSSEAAGMACSICMPDAKAEIGKPSVNFSLKDLDGKTVTLSDFKDKIVVLTWFDENCPYMKAHFEAGTFAKFAETYKDSKDVVLLNIDSNAGASAEKLKEANKANQVPQTTLIDPLGKVGMAYQAKTTPHCFVIGKDGKLKYAGAIDNAPRGQVADGAQPVNYVTQAIAELMAGQEVSVATSKPYGCSVKYPKDS